MLTRLRGTNFNDPLNVNIASVPAGYGAGLKKKMESVFSQIANYVPDPTKIPDYFRETQALNLCAMLKEKQLIKTALEVMAKQEVPVKHDGHNFAFDDTKKITLTPEKKAQAEAYVNSIKDYITTGSIKN